MENKTNKKTKNINERKTIGAREMIPYLTLASAIIKRAKRDIKKCPKHKEDAEYFMQSEWGKYLNDTVQEFHTIIDKSKAETKGGFIK